jgi:hypothetical protein
MSVSHITDNLILSSSPLQSKISHELSLSSSVTVDPSTDVLRSLFLSLSPPISPKRAKEVIESLQRLEDDNKPVEGFASRSIDDEEQALKDAVLGRLVAGIYAEALDTLLVEAITAEVEAEWWADLERSRLRVAYYFIQSTPSSLSFVSLLILPTCSQHCPSAFPHSLMMSCAYYIPITSPSRFRYSGPHRFVPFFREIPGGAILSQFAFSLIFVHTLALSRHHLHHF